MTAPHSRRLARPWPVLLGSAALLVAAGAADEALNRRLLETLPLDRRASLAENLERFDRLDPAERAAIRRLDESIAASEPVDRSRYQTLLQRYHLWFQGLPEEQRAALLGIGDLDERFRRAQAIRQAELSGPRREGPRIAKIRIGEYGVLGPFEAAFLIKVWGKLSPQRQAEIARKPPARIREDLKAEAGAAGVQLDQLPANQERSYAAKLAQDDEFRPLLDSVIRRVEQAIRKGDATRKADNAQKRFEHPYAEFLYFDEHRPRPVAPELLERFAESCPDWFHGMTDSLSADDARDYCTLVYRLIYPAGEMPEPPRPAKAGPGPAPSKAPRTRPDPNGPAF